MSFAWTDAEVRRALGMNPERADDQLTFTGVCTDSRKLEEGSLFVALQGERFDAHDFVAEALSRGARGAVVSREVNAEDSTRLYAVEDTLVALGRLAAHRRKALGARVVGITGSSGKTTTKDFLRETLRGSLRVHATEGNLNNRIGLPQTLLAVPDDAQVVVLEMGTNEPGEIGILTAVASPELGVITTVSEAHLEKLGSLDGVLDEKLDLLRGLPGGGVGVVGDVPPILAERAREVATEVKVVGWTDHADPQHRPADAEVDPRGCYRFRWQDQVVEMSLPGRHSVQNALLALCVADSLGVPADAAARRIGRVKARGLRSELRILGSLTVLADCYNANPQSVAAALELLGTIQELGSRVAVLGSMLELGEASARLHREVLTDALSRPLDLVVATGLFAEAAGHVAPAPEGPELVAAPELDEAGRILLERLEGTDVVLLKGSRGVALERLIPLLEERFGVAESSVAPAPGSMPEGGS